MCRQLIWSVLCILINFGIVFRTTTAKAIFARAELFSNADDIDDGYPKELTDPIIFPSKLKIINSVSII